MQASFRDYVKTLRDNDELIEIQKPVDLRNAAALVAQSDKALLFNNLPGYSMPVVSGLLQSRNRIALGMGVAYEQIADKLGNAMDKPIAPKRVAKAPVKEVIRTGKKVNLYDLPVPVFSVMDGGPMITGGVVIAEDA
jgi:2,5-furandicarboxylate decarboxylase 1